MKLKKLPLFSNYFLFFPVPYHRENLRENTGGQLTFFFPINKNCPTSLAIPCVVLYAYGRVFLQSSVQRGFKVRFTLLVKWSRSQ